MQRLGRDRLRDHDPKHVRQAVSARIELVHNAARRHGTTLHDCRSTLGLTDQCDEVFVSGWSRCNDATMPVPDSRISRAKTYITQPADDRRWDQGRAIHLSHTIVNEDIGASSTCNAQLRHFGHGWMRTPSIPALSVRAATYRIQGRTSYKRLGLLTCPGLSVHSSDQSIYHF